MRCRLSRAVSAGCCTRMLTLYCELVLYRCPSDARLSKVIRCKQLKRCNQLLGGGVGCVSRLASRSEFWSEPPAVAGAPRRTVSFASAVILRTAPVLPLPVAQLVLRSYAARHQQRNASARPAGHAGALRRRRARH